MNIFSDRQQQQNYFCINQTVVVLKIESLLSYFRFVFVNSIKNKNDACHSGIVLVLFGDAQRRHTDFAMTALREHARSTFAWINNVFFLIISFFSSFFFS